MSITRDEPENDLVVHSRANQALHILDLRTKPHSVFAITLLTCNVLTGQPAAAGGKSISSMTGRCKSVQLQYLIHPCAGAWMDVGTVVPQYSVGYCYVRTAFALPDC